jgi:short-subunit dehydrogenase
MNGKTVIEMSRICLPLMRTMKKGIILNVSSASVFFPQYLTPYSSVKAMVNSFSQSLKFENEEYGVIVQSCIAGKVYTPAVEKSKNKN